MMMGMGRVMRERRRIVSKIEMKTDGFEERSWNSLSILLMTLIFIGPIFTAPFFFRMLTK
jgi:hypothetical protein